MDRSRGQAFFSFPKQSYYKTQSTANLFRYIKNEESVPLISMALVSCVKAGRCLGFYHIMDVTGIGSAPNTAMLALLLM